VPLAAQNALFCIHAATNIEELQSVQIGGSRALTACRLGWDPRRPAGSGLD